MKAQARILHPSWFKNNGVKAGDRVSVVSTEIRDMWGVDDTRFQSGPRYVSAWTKGDPEQLPIIRLIAGTLEA